MNNVDYPKVRVQLAIQADADELAPILRPADRQELAAYPGAPKDPVEALQKAVMTSEACYVGIDKALNKPFCLFGISRVSPLYGAIWLLGSPGLDQHKWLFLRESPKWLKGLAQQYSVIGNIVLDSNTLHINWLRWLGFTFIKHHRGIGNNGEGFYEFCMLSKFTQDAE